jgi:hypothetical protein
MPSMYSAPYNVIDVNRTFRLKQLPIVEMGHLWMDTTAYDVVKSKLNPSLSRICHLISNVLQGRYSQ